MFGPFFPGDMPSPLDASTPEERANRGDPCVKLEEYARRNNRAITIRTCHNGFVISWGYPTQYRPITNMHQLHEAVDIFAGQVPEVRPSETFEQNLYDEVDRTREDLYRDMASDMAACLQACRHGMNAQHPAYPVLENLVKRAEREGLI